MTIFQVFHSALPRAFLPIVAISLLAGCKALTPYQTQHFIEGGADYVSASYAKKDQGSDWVAVSVEPYAPELLKLRIRSRADKKKPTCTFDSTFQRLTENTYQSTSNKAILLTFSTEKRPATLTLKPATTNDQQALSFYCSGGASLAGTYLLHHEELDQRQIDKRLFLKQLSWKDITLNLSTSATNVEPLLTIKSRGLAKNQPELAIFIDGTIRHAEFQDINADERPELLVYTQSSGSGSYGNVIAYTLTADNQLVPITLPEITEDNAISTGYMGHDCFTLVNHQLQRRFPIYHPSDTNANPSGKTRVIHYRLTNIDNHWQFIIDNISEEN